MIFPKKTPPLRIKRKLAAFNKKNHEKHPRSNQVRDINVPRTQEDYITKVSEEIDGRITKKLSQEFSRSDSRILGAISWLGEFLLNPLTQGHSGCVPETSRNTYGENLETNKDRSQNDSHSEARVSLSQSLQKFGPAEVYDTNQTIPWS